MLGLGLQLGSKSREQLIYGPELVVNGEFNGSATEWLVLGESTKTGGVGRIYSSAGSYSELYQTDILSIAVTYLVKYDVISTDGGTVINNSGSKTWDTATTGSKSEIYVSDAESISFKRSGVVDVTIDNVSVKEIL